MAQRVPLMLPVTGAHPKRGEKRTVKLRLTTIGQIAVTFAGRKIPLSNRKAQALLVYLSSIPVGSETRERLAGLLWSESDEVRARASLRQTIGDLKQAVDPLGTPAFTADRHAVHLDLTRVEVDVRDIAASLEQGEIDQVLVEQRRLTEQFAIGLEDLDPAFRGWLMVQRQCLHEKLVRTLERLAAAEREPGALKAFGTAMLNLDPSNEVGCRAVMNACAREGDTGGALRAYNTLWELLEQEYDAEPSEKTQALLFAIKMGNAPTAPIVDTAAATPGAASLAVSHGPLAGHVGQRMPAVLVGDFETTAVAPERQGLVRTIRHELIASLVRFRDWSVAEASSQPREDQVGPTYRVDATAFEDASSLQFVLTLKDSGSGRFVWSEQFSVAPLTWPQVHQKIIRRISGALGINISNERLNGIAGAQESTLPIYDRWLLGQSLSFRWRPDEEKRAESIFRSIIAVAPDFAPAYSSLVQILNSRHLIFPGRFRVAAGHAEALGLAKRAVALDPIDSRTHLSLAWSHAMSHAFDRAVLSYQLAGDLNANDPWTLVSSALGMAYCGESETARRLSAQALDLGLGLAPLHWAYQASVQFLIGNYAESIAAAANGQDALFYLAAWKAAAHAIAGDRRAADEERRRFTATVRANWHGAKEPSDADIGAWVLHCFPIARPEDWKRLRDGLRRAGLATPDRPSPPVGG